MFPLSKKQEQSKSWKLNLLEVKTKNEELNFEERRGTPTTRKLENKFQDVLPDIRECYKEFETSGECTLEKIKNLTLFIFQEMAEFNLIEVDQLFKEELLNANFSSPRIYSENTQSSVKDNLTDTNLKLGVWTQNDPLTTESLLSCQHEVHEFYKLLSFFSEGLGKAGNIVGYGLTTSGISAWHSLKRPDSSQHSGFKIMSSMTPSINISFGNLIRRAAKKRLLRKTDLKVYHEYSQRLGYDYNVGECATAYAAWGQWYIMACSETSGMPFKRAKLIGTIESLGMANWASVDNMFKHPSFSSYARAAMKALRETEWRTDPACVAGIWSGFYFDLKRRATEEGRWPKGGIYEAWAYTASQPIENTPATGVILFECGADPGLMLEYNIYFRRLNDILDVTTDAVTGEENNQLYAHLIPLFKWKTSREELARICMEYAKDTILLRNTITQIADTTEKGFQAKMFARLPPIWLISLSRYNIWHKFLLGAKSGIVPAEHSQPFIRWKIVDSLYLAQVFERADSSCVKGKCDIFLYRKTDTTSETTSSENPAFSQLYTSLVAGIIGLLLCHSCPCNCAEKLAEYVDAEHGGEICRFNLETLYSTEKDKIRHADILLELIDSEQFSIYRYAAAGVGYYFRELTQVQTGSLLGNCSLDTNSV